MDHDDLLQHTRTKTGCLTCRQRKKKCDERKPTCRNCEHKNVPCGGYKLPMKWKAFVSGERPTQISRHTQPSRKEPPLAPHEELLHAHQPGSHVRGHREPIYSDMNHDDFPNPADSRSNNNSYDSCEISHDELNHLPSISDVVPTTCIRRSNRLVSPLNIRLPALVTGIESALDRRLLHHFTYVVSSILVVVPDVANNPFNRLVLPMALNDREHWGLLDLIMSFSASHLGRMLRISANNEYTEEIRDVEKAKWARYGYAINQHSKNLASLMDSFSHIQERCPVDNDTCVNYAITTTMLLCQWCTCEGGDQSPWRLHLNACRELVRIKLKGIDESTCHLTDTSRLLLEWFYFHDTIATLTFPDRGCCIDLHKGTIEAFGASVPIDAFSNTISKGREDKLLWIGVNDGLLAIVSRILNLHSENITSREPTDTITDTARERSNSSILPQNRVHDHSGPDYVYTDQLGCEVSSFIFGMSSAAFKVDSFLDALAIEDALQSWNFQYKTSQESLVGESYRWAAFLLLHFTVYPMCSLYDAKVETTVRTLLYYLDSISSTDSALTCALLPLFICAVTLHRPMERQMVIDKVADYSRWSGLAHVEDVKKFLIAWWKQMDHQGTDIQSSGDDSGFQNPGQSWWAWIDFMKSRKLQLILV